MKISLSTLNWNLDRVSLREALGNIKAMGCEYADLAAFENWQGISPKKLYEDSLYREETARTVRESGLKVDSVNARFLYPLIVPEEEKFETVVRHFTALAEFSNQFRVRNMTICPGVIVKPDTCIIPAPGNPGVPDHFDSESPYACPHHKDIRRFYPRLTERALRLSEIARKYGICISLECHEGTVLEDPRYDLELMKQIYPQVGLTMDTTHFELQGYDFPDYEELFAFNRQAHVRYCAMGYMQCRRERNTFDFREYMEKLRETGYEDTVSIEFFSGFNSDEDVREVMDALKSTGCI